VSRAFEQVIENRFSETPALVGSKVAFLVLIVIAAIGLSVVGFIVAAPYAASHGHTAFASAIYTTFSYVCHQIPERSFHLENHKFAVCSRCTGLYVGFALTALGYPFVRSLKETRTPGITWLLLSAVPLVVDFSLTYFGIWQNTHLTRFVTGALLSSVAVFYIVPGLIELSSTFTSRFRAKQT